MKENLANQWQEKLYSFSMILAPLFLLATSIAEWSGNGPEKDGLGGTLKVITMFLFIYSVLGLTQMLWNLKPRAAVILRFIAILGLVGGIGYGYLGTFYEVLIATGASEAQLAEFMVLANGLEGGMTGVPILQYLGFTFPLSIIALGITLWRSKAVPAWAGILLAFAGLMFPIGQFPDIAIINYLADVLFVISLVWIGLKSLQLSTTMDMATETS